jgi:ABC-type transporter Mla subunit MlaD
MSDGARDPFSDMISMVAGPIAAVIRSFDQLRKNAEELRRGLENFNATMDNLNQTATRVNRLLNDFEEPIRAMLPQLTRTVKLADDWSKRISGPMDQVIPGLTRLAETLNSPVMTAFPTDLGRFMEVINDLTRRMSPLGQLAEQASGLFGLRIPGLSPRPATAPAEPPATAAAPSATERPATATRKAPAKKRAAKKAPAKKRATARKSAAKKSPARGS